jgi:hypothetical protein
MAYSKEEMEQLTSDHDYLKNTWFRLLDEIANGTKFERHVPPSLMSVCMRIVEMHSGVEVTDDSNPMLAVSFQTMADFGATMFIFGQYCMNDGLLAGNMVPCGCEKIDDEDLKRFIDKR